MREVGAERYAVSIENKNYFLTPNEIFSLGLSSGEFSVYAYLLRCTNRRIQQCWPSYKTIGSAVKMSANTVRKCVCWRSNSSSVQGAQRSLPGII